MRPILIILLPALIMYPPPDEVYQVHALSSRHPPSPKPGQPSRPFLGHNHNILGLLSPLEGMIALYSCLLKSTSY